MILFFNFNKILVFLISYKILTKILTDLNKICKILSLGVEMILTAASSLLANLRIVVVNTRLLLGQGAWWQRYHGELGTQPIKIINLKWKCLTSLACITSQETLTVGCLHLPCIEPAQTMPTHTRTHARTHAHTHTHTTCSHTHQGGSRNLQREGGSPVLPKS